MKKKRFAKKTQKQLGYVSIGAWVRPELRMCLAAMARSRGVSLSSVIITACERDVQEVTECNPN